MHYKIGYCTNVHAGSDLARTRQNLSQHAMVIQQDMQTRQPLGIGLWLSAATAAELQSPDVLEEFAVWLEDANLLPFTLNGFPYGDFHQQVVKHKVYEPTWRDAERWHYTLRLIEILHRLLPAGMEGSISTLPLQWNMPRPTEDVLRASAEHLRQVAARLGRLEAEQGRLIHVCLEPEPGCVLQRSEDVVRFFEQYLLGDDDEDLVRRHLRVCHDVCHAAVMFEGQREVLQRYRAAGIQVGKVQVSSAVILPIDEIDPQDRGRALDQLRGFAEDRYLHQTVVQEAAGGPTVFFEDLPKALALVEDPSALSGQWRVHFHVPIYLADFGLLRTSRDDILEVLDEIRQDPAVTHLEVETYAWGVLPAALRQATLAEGIAAELRWLSDQVSADDRA